MCDNVHALVAECTLNLVKLSYFCLVCHFVAERYHPWMAFFQGQVSRLCVCVCVCVCACACVCVCVCVTETDLCTVTVTDSKDIKIVLVWWYYHERSNPVSHTYDSGIKRPWAILICELKARIIQNAYPQQR